MAMESFNQISAMIGKKIGLRSNATSQLVWEWILKERMTLNGLATYDEYLKKLKDCPTEIQELIELIVVPETWFFRDRAVYEFLSQWVKKEWLSSPRPQPLKILSVPCSTGEEPYSIAMTLLDQGLSKTSFHIDAMDVSKKALARAHIGLYHKNSFRGKELIYRQRYFTKTEEGYSLQARVKETVHFFYGNILDSESIASSSLYDLVFFRNLLIYLEADAKKQAFAMIKKKMAPQGVLIVGSAEASLTRGEGFVSRLFPRAYAFSREACLAAMPSALPLSALTFTQLIQSIKNKKEEKPQAGKVNESSFNESDGSEEGEEKTGLIQEAAKLADNGCFEESTNLCLQYMNRFGANDQIYYLLGLMQHATGNEERAEQFFQKTVYLQPAHYEALIYLSLLYEKKGETGRADLFRQRAQKIHKA